MQLSYDEVIHIAQLARIELSSDEVEMFQKQLSEILTFVKKLDEVPTKNIEPTSQVTGIKNRLRDDEALPCLEAVVAAIKKNFPHEKNGYLKVKGVFEA
ncbi:MAG: Asp-tRNA(Asn)/Glu-tRNA(Gln) amidotransferase subunit GatC [Parcubacteria group bacterium]|nr:Asp-tRNA(Asn)/Glu-tRNA(Gln) amidotransferase subunit GatC [Parcubacteria group bacterium]